MRYSPVPRLSSRMKAGLAAASVLVLNVAGYAQGCALCYTQAGGAGQRFIQGLRTGILVLIVPPMFMSVGITWLAYSKRNKTKDRDDDNDSNEW